MPKRPTQQLAERAQPTPRGADAFLAGDKAPTPARRPRASRAEAKAEEASWEERHQRVTFHCPTELLRRVEQRMAATGQSKSRLLVDALEAYLAKR